MSSSTSKSVTGDGSGAPSSEARTGYDGLAAGIQVPRGLFSFRLSSSTPPLNGDLRVDLSRGLQGEINSSNPFNLKNQDTAKFFHKKWCKNFSSKLKTSKIKDTSKFMVLKVVENSSFSLVPSIFSMRFEWHFKKLNTPSTPRNRVNGVVKLENKKYYKTILIILFTSKNSFKFSFGLDFLNWSHLYATKNSLTEIEFYKKISETNKVRILLPKHLFIFKRAPTATPGKSVLDLRGGGKQDKNIKIPPHITDPKAKAKYLDDMRRQALKEDKERNKRKREEELKQAEEEKKLKLEEAQKQQKLAEDQAAADKAAADQAAADQAAADRKRQEDQDRLMAIEAQKKLDEQTAQFLSDMKNAKGSSENGTEKVDQDDTSSVDTDEVDSEWEKEVEERKERQNMQKKLKKNYAQALKDGLMVFVKHSEKGVKISNADFGTLEAGITELLDKAYDENKDVGVTGGGIIDGRAWYPVKNQETKDLLESEIPKINPPEGCTYKYLIADQDDKPKLYSCYVKKDLWIERPQLEKRLVRYTPKLQLPVVDEDGNNRQAHVKIKFGGVDKKAEINGDGFIVKVELDTSVVTKIIEEPEEPGMIGRVRFGAVSSTELQGHGVEARIKAKQEEIEKEAQKRKERREKIREKRRQKFLQRHQIPPKK